MGVDYHLVPKMLDVLDGIAHSRVVVKSLSQELSQKLALQDFFEEGGVRDFGS